MTINDAIIETLAEATALLCEDGCVLTVPEVLERAASSEAAGAICHRIFMARKKLSRNSPKLPPISRRITAGDYLDILAEAEHIMSKRAWPAGTAAELLTRLVAQDLAREKKHLAFRWTRKLCPIHGIGVS